MSVCVYGECVCVSVWVGGWLGVGVGVIVCAVQCIVAYTVTQCTLISIFFEFYPLFTDESSRRLPKHLNICFGVLASAAD